METKVHQKSSKSRPWAPKRISEPAWTSKCGPGGGLPPTIGTKNSKNNVKTNTDIIRNPSTASPSCKSSLVNSEQNHLCKWVATQFGFELRNAMQKLGSYTPKWSKKLRFGGPETNWPKARNASYPGVCKKPKNFIWQTKVWEWVFLPPKRLEIRQCTFSALAASS